MNFNVTDPVSMAARLLRGAERAREPGGSPGSAGPSTLQRMLQELESLRNELQNFMSDRVNAFRSAAPVDEASSTGAPGLGKAASSPAASPPLAAGPTPAAAAVGPGQGAADLVRNAGGVLQAKAIDGVNPASKQVVDVGGGTDKTFNYTNATDREQSVAYSDREGRKGTLTLQPGETGSFRGPSDAVGVRLSPSDRSGNTHPDEVLDEDGATIAPGADADAIQPKTLSTQNNDVSKVDGDKDFGGRSVNMTVVLGDGSTAGDGDMNHAYANPTDDAASMALAGNPSLTVNVVISDKAA